MGASGIIDRSRLDDAYRGFKTVFDSAFERAATNVDAVATTVQSDSAEEKYDWFGPAPKMREWIGDRAVEELSAYSQTITNKDWANGLRVRANDIRDDKLGLVRPRIGSLGREAGFHQWELIVQLLIAGFSTVCYDGQFFFDTDHADAAETPQSNKGTAALDATSYGAAWAAMMGITDAKGSYLRIQPDTLIVGPKLRSVAIELIETETLSTGGKNPNFGTAKLVVEPMLAGTYDDYWFLVAESGGVRPLILQQREPVEFIAQDDPASEGYFNRKEYRYGANWRGNVGYGLWQLAYGAIL